MAYEGEQILLSGVVAGEDLTAKQYYFVYMSADNTVNVVDHVSNFIPVGVLQNAPASGAAAAVCAIGVTKVSSEAALTYGTQIGPSADGQAEAKVAGTDAAEWVCGTVIAGSLAANGIATALVNCATAHNAVTAN